MNSISTDDIELDEAYYYIYLIEEKHKSEQDSLKG